MTGLLQNDEARYKNFFGRYLPGGDLYQVPEGPTRESLRRTLSSSDDIESVFGLFTQALNVSFFIANRYLNLER